MGNTVLKNEETTYLLPVSNISIPQLIQKINPLDENFFKYIPNELLNADQLGSKRRAFFKEAKKYRKTDKVLFSLSEAEREKQRAENRGKNSDS